MEGSSKQITDLSNCDLLLIFDYLKNYADRWNFSRTCKRHLSIFKTWLIKHNRLCFEANNVFGMPLRDMIAFFNFVGPHLKVITLDNVWNKKYALIEAFIGEYCTNADTLQFNSIGNEFHYGQLFKQLQFLENIEIQCLGVEDDYDRTTRIDLSRNVRLRNFSFARQGITHLRIGHLPNLESIRLDKFTILNIRDGYNLYVTLTNVRVLQIGNNAAFAKLDLGKLLECCLQLDELIYGITNWYLDAVTELPRLKRLTLITHEETSYGLETPKTHFFTLLAKNLGHQLVYLKLVGCMHLTCDQILILAGISSLTSLNFSRNPRLYNNHLKFLGGLVNLETITLTECANITDCNVLQILQICRNLTRININNCNFPREDQVEI